MIANGAKVSIKKSFARIGIICGIEKMSTNSTNSTNWVSS